MHASWIAALLATTPLDREPIWPLVAVYGLLQRQATTLAFGDAFALLAIGCAIAAFVTLMAKPVKAPVGAPPSDAH